MIYLAIGAAALLGLVEWQRRVQRRERPLSLWGNDYAGAEAAVIDLETASHLRRVRRSDGLGWLANVVFLPVWFIWGDLRARRPERQLLRWRLDGMLSNGRAATISLEADRALLAIACKSVGLWADRSRPLEQQEGLRIFGAHNEARFAEGIALVQAAFALGFDQLRLEDGMLSAETALSNASPRALPALFASLEDLAALAER